MECDLQISNPGILDTLNLEVERSYSTPYATSPLLPLLILSLMRQRIAPKTAKTIESEYDYIVVGAGAGGSSVAARLSEMHCVNVLVLEAGGTPPVLSDIPGIARYFIGSKLDWAFKTVPQKYAARAHDNRQMAWPSGKGIGGSSLISGLVYQRGSPKVYDQWAAQGATGWNFEEVLPYFLKLEDNWDYDLLANGYHSIGGPATAQRPGYRSEIECPILQAAQQMGYDFIDTNGPRQTGFSDFQGDIGGGQRCNAAEDYLVAAENRTNLDILANAQVTKVLIDDRNQAVGVQFDYDGSTYSVRARREVIVSAGTVNTAKLLMNSGIGPKDHLQELDIPVVADLPVGNNLQDHISSMVFHLLDPSILTPQKKLTDLRYLEEYISNRTGPLSSLEFISTVAFFSRESDPPYVDFPSHQMHILEVPVFVMKQMNINSSVYEQYFAKFEDQPVSLCLVSALQPKSRGVVRLQTANPYDAPLIDPNYFADPSDVEDIVQGLKTCQKIANSEPLQMVGSRDINIPFPGCGLPSNGNSYLECIARSVNFAFPHTVGTAKMGDPADPTTVVDPQLRVKGVNGLRVVDASVMPIIPTANTFVPTVMVGEKAADIIKETISCPVLQN